MRKPVIKIVEEFSALIDYSVPVIDFAIGAGQTAIEVSNPLNAKAGGVASIDGTEYAIVTVSGNTVLVEGEIADPQRASFGRRPFFVYGTPVKTNVYLSTLQQAVKFPMIYIPEILSETKVIEDESIIDTEAELRVFFLDGQDQADSTFAQYDDVIARMRNVSEFYEDAIIGNHRFAGSLINRITRINHVDFGRYLTDRGHMKHVFDDSTSGVEMRFTLPIKKCLNCDCL